MAFSLVIASVGGLLGCQSLPALPQVLAVRSGPTTEPATAQPPIQLQGARGLLSAAQSQRVLEALRSDLPDRYSDSGILLRHLAVEEAVADSPLTTGNAVQLLQDGPATYAAMLAAIALARDHINMETYILDDDEVGQRFAQALLDKQKAGVQVNLIHDSVGTWATPRAFFERLRAGGVQVLEFNPVNPLGAWLGGNGWSPNQRDHRKLLIVDGHTAFLGGINISSVYSGGSRSRVRLPTRAAAEASVPWRDTDMQLQGPVVAELQKLFIASWVQQCGEEPVPRNYFPPPQVMGRQLVRAIASMPRRGVDSLPPEADSSPIYSALLSAIGHAEATVQITNAYFVPDPQLLAALSGAAARGVDVQLILPGQTDSWLVFHAGRAHYDTLLQAGVKIHERQGAVLHAKTAVIDGIWSTVGSTNLDWRSFLHNHEVNAVVLGSDLGAQMQSMFAGDLRAASPVLLPAWRDRSWLARLKEFFASWWAYWL